MRLATPSDQQLERYGLANDAQGAGHDRQAGLAGGDVRYPLGRPDHAAIGEKNIANADDASNALSQLDLSKGVAMNITNKNGQRFVFVKSEK